MTETTDTPDTREPVTRVISRVPFVLKARS
jgi:hypothetical protein